MTAAAANAVPCPHCKTGSLTAVVNAPFARGFLVAVQHGTKRIAGCPTCVGKKLREEAGKSLLFGWFSISALILNVFFIPWNFARSFFVQPNPAGVTKLFDEIGVPQPGTEYRLTDAFYAAAVAMIRADGKIEASEVEAAKRHGQLMLPDFKPERLDQMLADKGGVATMDALATVFRVYLNARGHQMVMDYLITIARADGQLARAEDKYLESLALKLGAVDNYLVQMTAATSWTIER